MTCQRTRSTPSPSSTPTAPYHHFAAHFDAWQDTFGAQYHQIILGRILRVLTHHDGPDGPASRPRRLADLGSGTGGLACALATHGYVVTGVDRSEAMVALARRKADTLSLLHPPEFLAQDIRTLQLARPVDAAVCVYTVINHLTDPADLDRALSAIFRSLVPGGLFLFELNLPACYERYWSTSEIVHLDGVDVIRDHRWIRGTPRLEAQITIRRLGSGGWEETYDRIEQRIYSDGEVEMALASAGFSLLEREVYNPFEPQRVPVKGLWSARRT
jgi:SAM-dependent methyltransferase